MGVITDNLALIGSGLLTTLEIAILSYLGALIVGTIMAAFRVSPIPPLRVVGAVWVAVTCNVPLLCLMILLAFGLPSAGVQLSLFWAATGAIAISASGFVCETVRSGINAVPVGNAEAARALGLTFIQSLRHIILPQAFARTVQPLVNIFISTLIGSSLAAAVGVAELTNITQQLNLRYAEAIVTFLTSGLTYLVIALLATSTGARLERRFSGQQVKA